MKFSVVIPIYNKEDYIARAIKSILRQTHQDFELIIVDDGSTDSGVNVVKKFEDKRIKIIQQPNRGVSAARNKGIYLANNDYICFLDADDEWKSNFLDTINSLIKEYPNGGAYATGYELVTESLKTISPKNISGNEKKWKGIVKDYFKSSFNMPLISASSVVIPKNVFKEVGDFSVSITRGEDLHMWARIALRYNIVFNNEVCVSYYRNTKNSLTKRKSTLDESFVKDAENFLEIGRGENYYSFYFEEYMIKKIIEKSRYYIANGNYKEARKLLYKYRHTKCNKRFLFTTLLKSWIPKSIF